MHRLLTRAVSGGAATTYKYDATGNLVTKLTGSDTSVYGWSLDGKLTRIALPGGTEVAYVYDSKGNRVRQTVAAGSTVVTKQYIVDYSVPLSRVLADEDEDDIVQASYSYGNDLLAMKQDGVGYYFYYDRLGSVRNVTDDSDSAGVVKNYLYDGFGNVIIGTSGSPVNVYQFTGEEYDAEPGFVYLRARYYDPEVGRFLSRDPLIDQAIIEKKNLGCTGCSEGDNLDLLNILAVGNFSLHDVHAYLYCNNNSVNWTDPAGLKSCSSCYDDFEIRLRRAKNRYIKCTLLCGPICLLGPGWPCFTCALNCYTTLKMDLNDVLEDYGHCLKTCCPNSGKE